MEASEIFDALPPGPFQIIYADPPWSFANQAQKGRGDKDYAHGAEAEYPTLSVEDLKLLPVKSISDKRALLFMWAPNSQLKQAIELGEAWGFKFVTVPFIWKKGNCVNPGSYTLQSCEQVLVFKRNARPKGDKSYKERQWVETEFFDITRTGHSVKPDAVRKRIERMYPSVKNRIELFARKRAEGWSAWGDEI